MVLMNWSLSYFILFYFLLIFLVTLAGSTFVWSTHVNLQTVHARMTLHMRELYARFIPTFGQHATQLTICVGYSLLQVLTL